MFALVLAREKADRDLVARMLSGRYRVEGAGDLREARAVYEKGTPARVVLVWPSAGGVELVNQLRTLPCDTPPFLVALLGDRPTAEIADVIGVDADDFMRRPWCQEELLARLDAPERAARRAAKGAAPGGRDLTALKAYPRLGEIVSADLAAMLGDPLKLSPGWAAPASVKCRGSAIPLSLASDGTELRVSIVTDTESLPALGERLLGNARASVGDLDDALRELANTAAGAVKRACLAESIALTTGLPVEQHALPPEDPTTRRWCAAVAGARLRVGIATQVVTRLKLQVHAGKLIEGMVVAQDLRSESGALLVTAGTRLTATSAPRLAHLLGDRALVEVTNAA